MTVADRSQSFFDGFVARILAMILAVLIGLFLVTNWSDDFINLFSGNSSAPTASADQPAKELNPSLMACLERRVGDVEQMKADGFLSDAKYRAFRARAEDLCRVQNPG
ncbi:MAG: hypothetical protein JKX93_02675 [Rhizobiaceae bacterium]|nr:hypothetical protein [Rhizobiaceae bacterium]